MIDFKRFGTRVAKIAEVIIFESRWTLAPLYACLILGLIRYFFSFIQQLIEMFAQRQTTEDLMLTLLSLVDITMVGNLVYMVAVGGYSIFVREIDFHGKNNKPRFLNNINSGTLKIKMGMSLIGVSSVHLLKDFMNAEHQDWNLIGKRLAIHGLFLLSTYALAKSDKMLHPEGTSDAHETKEQDHG